MKNLNLTLKFLLPVLVGFFLIVVLLGYQIGALIKRTVVNQAVSMSADFVQLNTLKHVASSSDFSLDDPQKTERLFEKVSREVKTRGAMRIKVWDKKGMVIFSEDKTIVGQTFSDNHEFQESIEGKVEVEIKKPLKRENVSEKGYRQLMEVYVPIVLDGQVEPAGVVEVYYNIDELSRNIRQIQLQIILINLAAFLMVAVIITLLFHFLVVKPLRSLEAGMMEIKEKGV